MKKRIMQTVSALLIAALFVPHITLTAAASTTKPEIEPNNESTTAMAIETNQIYQGILSDGSDIDWFQFANDKDYFTLRFDTSDANIDDIRDGWRVIIYDGSKIIKSYTNITETFETPILPFQGSYQVKVSAQSSSSYYCPNNCTYNLTINTVEDETWESEYNDDSATANIIQTDKTYTGSFYNGDDIDWYQFTNEKAYFTLKFDTSAANVDAIKDGWRVTIYDGTDIIKKYALTDTFVTPILPFKGTYRIKVEPVASGIYYAPIDCKYKLQISTAVSSSWEAEKNDAKTTATKVALNKTYNGMLYNQDDVDWYTFDTTKGAFKLKFAIDSSTSIDAVKDGWKITFYSKSASEPLKVYNNVTKNFTTDYIKCKGKINVKIEAAYSSVYYAPIDCRYTLKLTEYRAAAPSKVTASLYKNYDDVKVSWKKVSGAKGYYVYYKKSTAKNYSLLKKTTALSVTKKNLADGTKYYFKVIPYFVDGGKTVKSITYKTTSTTTLKKISKPTMTTSFWYSGKVIVSWKNIAGESGYQISKSTKKTGTSIVATYKTTTEDSKAITAKKNVTYYYKVRAYKTVDGKKIYGPWSTVRSYKLK